jgi:hypothetical protein
MQPLSHYLPAVSGWLNTVIVIGGGWLIARVLCSVTARALRLFHFNQFCERLGVGEVLRKGEVALTPSELVGRGLYWVILLAALIEAARLLDIGPAVALRQQIVAAIPAFASAVLVLAAGLIVVSFLAGVVRTLSRNAGSPYARLWARITRWAGATLVVALAIEQARIRGSVLAGVLYIIVAAFALGMALAFGLGCKDMARSAMERLIADLKERHREDSQSDLEG